MKRIHFLELFPALIPNNGLFFNPIFTPVSPVRITGQSLAARPVFPGTLLGNKGIEPGLIRCHHTGVAFEPSPPFGFAFTAGELLGDVLGWPRRHYHLSGGAPRWAKEDSSPLFSGPNWH